MLNTKSSMMSPLQKLCHQQLRQVAYSAVYLNFICDPPQIVCTLTIRQPEKPPSGRSHSNQDTLVVCGNNIERVLTAKLLGVHIDNNLRWTTHTDALTKRVSSKLYTLKQVEKIGLSEQDILIFHTAVIRPVLEYDANVVWHHFITVAQPDRLEALQKRAMRYHSSPLLAITCIISLEFLNLDFFSNRRVKQSMTFLDSICQTESCLNHLFPSKRHIHLTYLLRHPRICPTSIIHTHCYCSFISALTNYK